MKFSKVIKIWLELNYDFQNLSFKLGLNYIQDPLFTKTPKIRK